MKMARLQAVTIVFIFAQVAALGYNYNGDSLYNYNGNVADITGHRKNYGQNGGFQFGIDSESSVDYRERDERRVCDQAYDFNVQAPEEQAEEEDSNDLRTFGIKVDKVIQFADKGRRRCFKGICGIDEQGTRSEDGFKIVKPGHFHRKSGQAIYCRRNGKSCTFGVSSQGDQTTGFVTDFNCFGKDCILDQRDEASRGLTTIRKCKCKRIKLKLPKNQIRFGSSGISINQEDKTTGIATGFNCIGKGCISGQDDETTGIAAGFNCIGKDCVVGQPSEGFTTIQKCNCKRINLKLPKAQISFGSSGRSTGIRKSKGLTFRRSHRSRVMGTRKSSCTNKGLEIGKSKHDCGTTGTITLTKNKVLLIDRTLLNHGSIGSSTGNRKCDCQNGGSTFGGVHHDDESTAGETVNGQLNSTSDQFCGFTY